MRRLRWACPLLALLLVLALVDSGKGAPEVLQFGFEGRDTLWVQADSRASFRETVHRITDEKAHGGQRSEQIMLDVEQGEFIHYAFNVGRAPAEDLLDPVSPKADGPAFNLMAGAAPPQERDPKNLQQPLTVLIKGDSYVNTSRWQPLGIRQPVKRLNEQIIMLRNEQKR